MHKMSGAKSLTHWVTASMRALSELTFQVAMRMAASSGLSRQASIGAAANEARGKLGELNGKAGAAAAGGFGERIVDLERLTDQVVGEVDLRAAHIFERNLVDQQFGLAVLDEEIVRRAGIVEGEGVREAGAAAAGDRDAQHRARGFAGQN